MRFAASWMAPEYRQSFTPSVATNRDRARFARDMHEALSTLLNEHRIVGPGVTVHRRVAASLDGWTFDIQTPARHLDAVTGDLAAWCRMFWDGEVPGGIFYDWLQDVAGVATVAATP